MEQIYQSLWKWLLEIVFPAFCLGCRQEGTFLCRVCEDSIVCLGKQLCPVCRRQNLFGKICEECKNPEIFIDGVISAVSFQEQSLLQKCIYAFKYDFVEDLAISLGKILFRAFKNSGLVCELEIQGSEIFACAVPLHVRRLNFRGFNQADLLTRHFLELWNVGNKKKILGVQFLERSHFHRPQMELRREARIANIKDAFIVREEQKYLAKNATIVLIDDVTTTLSTLNNCAKVLKAAGAKRIFGLVLAHGLK